MTTINTIPNFSQEPPSTSDPDNFDVRADGAFADLHNSIIPDMNTSIGQMNTVADEVESNKTATDSNKEECENAETSAIAARDKAEKWANETEDVEVETGKYSALHFAAKAEAAVAVLPEGTIDDNLIATDKAWSSDKISTELGNIKDTWVTKATDFTAEAGGNYAVDTTAIVPNCTLPVSPNIDDKISFLDLKQNFGTNALNLLRNGELIMGKADDVSIDQDNFNFSLVYTSEGWVII